MNKNINKALLLVIVSLVTLTAIGCGGSGDLSKLGRSVVAVNKNGNVESLWVEDFGESYYEEDELREMTENEIAAFSLSNGENAASLEDLKVEDGVAHMKMKFGTAENYADFNEETFIYETVSDAKLSGHINADILVDKDGGLINSLKASELSDEHVIITDSKTVIAAPYDIEFMSKGVSLIDNKTADLSTAEGDAPVCIVLSK